MRIKYLDSREIDLLGDPVVSVSGVAVVRSDPIRFDYSFPKEQFQRLGERKAAKYAAMASLRLAAETAETEADDAKASYYQGLIAHETSVVRPALMVVVACLALFSSWQLLQTCTTTPSNFTPAMPRNVHDWSEEQVSGWFSTMAGETRENKATLYLIAQASGKNNAICKAAICAGAPKVDAAGRTRLDVVAARNYIRSRPWTLVVEHIKLNAEDFGESPEYVIKKLSEVIND